MRVALVAACLLAVCTPTARGTEFNPQYGGAVLETWVSNHPTEPNRFIVWTAEPGPRIRRIVADPGIPGEHSYSFDSIERSSAGAPNEALHHIWIADDLTFGVAVGSGGILLVAEDLLNNDVWHELPFPGPAGAHCWESIWSQDGSRGFVATENGLFEWRNCCHDPEPWPKPAPRPDWWLPVTDLPDPLPGIPRRYLALGGTFSGGGGSLPQFRGAVGVRHHEAGAAASGRSIYFLDETVSTSWQEACMNPSAPGTPPLDPICAWDLHVWDIDFDATAGIGFAVGGQRLGNGVGYAFRSTDWGRTWQLSLPEPDPPGDCTIDPCTGESGCVLPDAYTCANQPPLCGTASPGVEGWPYGTWQFATLYGVTALPDGRAVAVSYGAGLWIFDPDDDGWTVVSDSRYFATGPLWGVHHAQTFPGSGKGEIWISGLFGDIRHAPFSAAETDDTTIGLACNWRQLPTGGGDLTRDRCPSYPWPIWYPSACPPDDAGTAYPVWRLSDVSFGSSSVGYVVGELARIAKSTDGGASWSEQRMDGDPVVLGGGLVTLGKVHAVDEDSVVTISNGRYWDRAGPTIFYTTNGGEPLPGGACADAVSGAGWNRAEDSDLPQVALATAKIRDLTSHGGVFWALADDGLGGRFKLWASTDGGKSWIKYNPSGSTAGFQARGLAFSGPATAYVVGSRNGGGAVYRVEPGPSGPVATELAASCSLPPLVDVDAYAPTQGDDVVYAVGNEGLVVLVSPLPVVCLPTPTSENLLRVDIAADATESLTVFATGMRGVVLRGEHGVPSSWVKLQSRSTDKLTGACFPSPELGWVAGQNRSGGPATPDRWADASILRYEAP